MMHPKINPCNQVLLCNIFPIEKVVEVDHGRAWEVQIPHAAGSRFCFLPTGDCEVVSSPVGVIQESLGTNHGLHK